MRALLTGFGSTGDFEPLLALAIEMRRNGHQPVVGFLPQYASRVEQHGVEFTPIGPASLFDALQDSIRTELTSGTLEGAHLSPYTPADMKLLFRDLYLASARVEVLVGLAEWPFGRMVHELRGTPYVSLHLDHFNARFAAASRDAISDWESHLAAVINPMRTSLGLERSDSPITSDGNSQQLALFGVSRLMLDPELEPEWPAHHHVTGFLLMKEEPFSPGPELVEFLTAKEPPVLFTFGSMTYGEDADLAGAVLEAIERIDRRVILQHGWGELFQKRRLPKNVLTIGFVPYGWLLPRVSCVVQSGGAGTTAWALRSGVPTVCLPHLWQQFSYAAFAEAYGCGLVIPHKSLTGRKLAAAVSYVLSDPAYREAAGVVSVRMRSEGGARAARLAVERWFDRMSSQTGLPRRRRLRSSEPALGANSRLSISSQPGG